MQWFDIRFKEANQSTYVGRAVEANISLPRRPGEIGVLRLD